MPALSGSQKAYMFAQGGVGRGGAIRGNYASAKTFVSVGGTHRAFGQSGTSYKIIDLTIVDILNEAPNTCAFTAVNFTPTVGQDVIITFGSKNNGDRQFAGQILSVEQAALGKPANVAYRCSCIDYTWGLNKRKVTKKYTATTVAAIASDLITSFTSGYTVKVDATFGTTAIDEISFTFQDMSDALTQLAKRGGGYWLCDYAKVVRLFTTDTSSTAPTQLTASHATLELKADVRYLRDLSQVITRVLVEGGGPTSLAEVSPGDTVIPVDDATWFDVAGGTVVSGPQRITYTGRTLGDAGSVVGPGAAPSAAPSVTLVDGSAGVDTGAHTWAYTFVTGAGESLPSPLASATTDNIAAPTNAPALTSQFIGSGSMGVGFYTYAYTFTNSVGETTVGPRLGIQVAGANTLTNLHDIFPGSVPVTGRKLYRTAAQVDAPTANTAQLKLLNTFADNSTQVFADSFADASLGANAPSSNTAAANHISLAGIAIGGSGTTSRKVYRTAANASQLKLLTTIADNTTTTFSDTTADSSLGANAPTSDTSGLTQPDGIVAPGATSIIVAGTGAFSTSGGWAVIGNGRQVIRYTGISGSSLTGVPASGPGAITAAISYNSTITGAPQLTGIPASGAGSILYRILTGDEVNLLAQVDDTTIQTALAALIGGDGVQEDYVQDRRLSRTEATARGNAILALRGQTQSTIAYTVRDLNADSGRTQSVNLASPTSISGSFLIQQVTMSGFYLHPATTALTTQPETFPRRQVTASSTRFSLEDLLRQIKRSA